MTVPVYPRLPLALRERINRLVARETGRQFEDVTRDGERDFWLTAPEALDYGLVSQIIASAAEVHGHKSRMDASMDTAATR